MFDPTSPLSDDPTSSPDGEPYEMQNVPIRRDGCHAPSPPPIAPDTSDLAAVARHPVHRVNDQPTCVSAATMTDLLASKLLASVDALIANDSPSADFSPLARLLNSRLSTADLAHFPGPTHKRVLGQFLFNLIERSPLEGNGNELASKITGLLLERMRQDKVLLLLNSNNREEELQQMISEALAALSESVPEPALGQSDQHFQQSDASDQPSTMDATGTPVYICATKWATKDPSMRQHLLKLFGDGQTSLQYKFVFGRTIQKSYRSADGQQYYLVNVCGFGKQYLVRDGITTSKPLAGRLFGNESSLPADEHSEHSHSEDSGMGVGGLDDGGARNALALDHAQDHAQRQHKLEVLPESFRKLAGLRGLAAVASPATGGSRGVLEASSRVLECSKIEVAEGDHHGIEVRPEPDLGRELQLEPAAALQWPTPEPQLESSSLYNRIL